MVARWQLVRLGLTEAAIDTRVWTGRLYRVHQGVYTVGHPYVHRNGRLLAAALAFGPRAVLSHRTGLSSGGS